MKSAEYWIQELNLEPHSEGGFFKETYRSSLDVEIKELPHGFKGSRRLSTSIYYLLRSGEISKLHRLRSDELWYYHYGSAVKLIFIDPEGKKKKIILGSRVEKAEHLQVLIPAGTIFAAEVVDKKSYSLVGCMVSPGFEYDDFEMYDKEDLIQAFPKHIDIIEKYC
ncbi:MAG: cupin domain-containing protein [Bacteroidales bacterium]|nr:cupin domain-containing protein [Bacteroidales bacterium]